jgi:hypothetical protein
MFTVDLGGLERLIAQLENRSLAYQSAIDNAVEFARTTILNRVKLGQTVDGTYRVSKRPYDGSRYSRRQFNFRKNNSRPLPTSSHNLFVTGALHKNFVISNSQTINKGNKSFVRQIGFTSSPVQGKNITYAQLANIQERNTGIGFQLSPSQMIRVMARFKQVAGL